MLTIFDRNKHVGMRVLSPELTEVRTAVVDTFHQAEVVLQIAIPSKTIVAIRGNMERSINPECPEALQRLQAVRGAEIGTGITSWVDRTVGGSHGCTKLANLVLEAVQLATLGLRRYSRDGETIKSDTLEEEVRYLLAAYPEMRNICPPYADDSPYLKGKPLPLPRQAETPAVANGWPRLKHIAPRDTQLLYLSRNKIIMVEAEAGGAREIVALARLDDFRHTMEVEIQVELPALRIARVSGRMPRIPYPYCAEATLPKLRELEGTYIAPGLTGRVTRWAHREICFHYNNLILEACHGAIEATLGLYTHRHSLSQGILDTAQQEWLGNYPVFRGKCLAYPAAGHRQTSCTG